MLFKKKKRQLFAKFELRSFSLYIEKKKGRMVFQLYHTLHGRSLWHKKHKQKLTSIALSGSLPLPRIATAFLAIGIKRSMVNHLAFLALASRSFCAHSEH